MLSAAPAYAASIGSSDIARNAVLSRHIKVGNVTTSDIADNAVDQTKLAAGSVGSGEVRRTL